LATVAFGILSWLSLGALCGFVIRKIAASVCARAIGEGCTTTGEAVTFHFRPVGGATYRFSSPQYEDAFRRANSRPA
jgi:hypothetical protein